MKLSPCKRLSPDLSMSPVMKQDGELMGGTNVDVYDFMLFIEDFI